MNKALRNSYSVVLLACLAACILLVAPLCLSKGLNHDELEHVHATWYVANGYLPYLDFFQNHNPLLWYLFAPVILVLGETAVAILAIRAITFLIMAGTLVLVFFTARKLTSSWQTGVLSVLLLLTSSFYVKTGFEFRPDVPQVFFGLLAVFILIDFWRTPSLKSVFFCGVSLSLSFLFLQKAVFLIAAVGVVFLYQFIRERLPFKFLIWFAAGFLIPAGIFSLYLLAFGLLEDYVITNYLVNLNRLREYSPLRTIRSFVRSDYLFMIAAVTSLPYLLIGKTSDEKVRRFAVVGLLVGLSILLYDRPHKQSFLQFLVLAGITSAIMLQGLFNRYVVYSGLRIILVFILLGVPVRAIIRIHNSSIQPRLKAIEFVVENTSPEDLVYDGNIIFNVFRPDLHYVWYSVTPGKLLDSYNLVTNNRYGDYDIYDLILEKNPRIISVHGMGLKNPRSREILSRYEETPHKNIYVRKTVQLNKENPR